jgi:transcriptional regulator with XRE-family HTH domain
MSGDRKPLEADLVVGANVRKLRGENGLTLQEFSSQLGMSHQQLQKYETGTTVFLQASST